MSRFSVTAAPLDLAQLRASLQDPRSGGYCAFEGWVRDSNEGRAVSGLEYEAFTELATSEGERILEEAAARFGITAASAVHRVGDLRIGDLAVWIGVSAPHRDAAFRACRYIIDEIKHRLPIWKKEHYLEGDSAWVACTHGTHGYREDDCAHHGHAPHQHAEIPGDFVPDYSRQTRLAAVGEAGQSRLAAARVLVIGAGGLGCPVISYLAGAGVGHLTLVDGDRLEASNLHRQVMYAAADIGEHKAELAARRVRALNPAVSVEVRLQPLTANDSEAVFAAHDLVVECTDDLDSRYLANDAALVTGTPLLLASVHQYEGQLQWVLPGVGNTCMRCLWPKPAEPGWAGSCAEAGVLGPVPGVLGTLQAMEALKLLLGLPGIAPTQLRLVNLLEGTQQALLIDAAHGCAREGGCAAVARRELTRRKAVGELDRSFPSLAAAHAAGYVLVDVRDADEVAAQPLSLPARHIAATELDVTRLPDPAARWLLVCASGRRSHRAAQRLREQGVEAWSLAGGVAKLAEPRG